MENTIPSASSSKDQAVIAENIIERSHGNIVDETKTIALETLEMMNKWKTFVNTGELPIWEYYTAYSYESINLLYCSSSADILFRTKSGTIYRIISWSKLTWMFTFTPDGPYVFPDKWYIYHPGTGKISGLSTTNLIKWKPFNHKWGNTSEIVEIIETFETTSFGDNSQKQKTSIMSDFKALYGRAFIRNPFPKILLNKS